MLLKHWKELLERDIKNEEETDLSASEWQQVQEGLSDYENGHLLTLEEFLKKR